MFTVLFLVFAVLSFLYYGICAIAYSPRSSVLYFWLLLSAFFTACSVFPRLWTLLQIPFFLFWFLFFIFLLFALPKKNQREKAPDALILLGVRNDGTLPSSIFRNRVHFAASLMRENPNAVCILSGGRVFGEKKSEGEVLLSAMLSQGFPKERFVLETKSRTTKENFLLAFPLLPKETGRIGIVTSSYHLFRGKITALSSSPPAALSFYGAGAPAFFLPHLYLREWFTFSVDLISGNIKIKKQ